MRGQHYRDDDYSGRDMRGGNDRNGNYERAMRQQPADFEGRRPFGSYGDERNQQGRHRSDEDRFDESDPRLGHHDQDYAAWRDEQLNKLDSDYQDWRSERRKKFADEFDKWRTERAGKSGQQTSDQNKKL